MSDYLPEFVKPMLALRGEPFDGGDDWLFEIKWDGTRGLAFVEDGRYRLRNRRNFDMVPRYPELELLAGLEDGCVLDGEVVALVDGKPSFQAVMQRDHVRDPDRARVLSRSQPVTYVVFDLLYRHGERLLDRPLRERRDLLADVLDGRVDGKHLVMSDGVVGDGIAFFENVVAEGLEGVVGKRLDSKYESGRRTGAWTKVKRTQVAHCLVIGYLPDGAHDLKSLIVATVTPAEDGEGDLRCVGKVGSGLGERTRAELLGRLTRIRRDAPIVSAPELDGVWVEPELIAVVSYLELTPQGNLRAPVFERWLDAPR